MKKTFVKTLVSWKWVLLLICIAFYSCDHGEDISVSQDLSEPDPIGEVVDDISTDLLNARTLSGSGTLYGTDWSGTVHIAIVYEEAQGHHPQVAPDVPPGYILVGGGANVTPEYTHPGALLTASYPDANLSTWHAASKDHGDDFYHTLVGYAIGLKLDGAARDVLENYISLFQNTSSSVSHPSTQVSVVSGYTLIGGGARVNYGSGSGNLLVKSIPVGNAWYVKSKDHKWSSPATITAYAIGIQTNIPGFGELEIGQESTSSWASGNFGSSTVTVDNSWVISCPGGEAQYTDEGRLLTGIKPSFRSVTVISKDHFNADAGLTYSYAVRIRKKM